MKSTIFLLLQSISLLIILGAPAAYACGPFYRATPYPDFFTANWDEMEEDKEREENIALWQQLTSKVIPASDIVQAVYKDSSSRFWDLSCSSIYGEYFIMEPTTNKFYIYLRQNNDEEIRDFLFCAKSLEEARRQVNSPWFYPEERDYDNESPEFDDIIENINNYKGSRLKDRYALQMVRALFASRRYDRCINYYEETFSGFPDSNLFKRMAMKYVAGAWTRIGDVERANKFFAEAGDIYSLCDVDRVAYMAEHNPNSPALIQYIIREGLYRHLHTDYEPTAQKLLRNNKVDNRGDWEFLLAYIAGEFDENDTKASYHIRRAMNEKFSSQGLHDHARAYRFKIDSRLGNISNLADDMLWFESRMKNLDSDWADIMKNIVYDDLVKTLWKRGDYVTAILACSFADNVSNKIWNSKGYETNASPRDSYATLSFQLLYTLSSEQLIQAKRLLAANTPLYKVLRKHTHFEESYINDIIGTVALREENYSRAVKYLALVPLSYQRTMNVWDYLYIDPFKAYPTRWEYRQYQNDGWWFEFSTATNNLKSADNAKLNFARRMRDYRQKMNTAATSDERGLARLMYAIGRLNSFENCWALTQYWRGEFIVNKFYSYLNIEFDYHTDIGHVKTEEIYKREVAKALAMLKSDEAKAEAEYILGNLKTVVKRYEGTSTAQFVKTSCDNWENWL